MTWTIFTGLLLFSAVTAFTPGPNNLLALSSGANWGYRRTIPHILGVCVGFASMMILVGAGLGIVLQTFPLAFTVLKFACFAYLIYLAGKIATAKGMGEGRTADKPITLFGSAAFQWINPKAWIASITIVSSFTNPDAFWQSLLIGGATNIFLAFLAVSTWTLFGTIVKTWLSRPLRLKIFNWSMAILLIISVIPSFFH